MRKQLSKKEIKELNSKLEKYGIRYDKKDNVELRDKRIITVNNEPRFFYHEDTLVPNLKILLKNNILKKISVDMGAVKFMIKGADLMRPGITSVDEEIEKDEIISIVDQIHDKPVAVGVALFSGREMYEMKEGKVIENIHYVGDDIWNYK